MMKIMKFMSDTKKMSHAHVVMEKYFDTDILDAEDAMEVCLEHGVDYETASAIAQNMFETGE